MHIFNCINDSKTGGISDAISAMDVKTLEDCSQPTRIYATNLWGVNFFKDFYI